MGWWDDLIQAIKDRQRRKPVPKPTPRPSPPNPVDVTQEQEWVFSLTNAERVNNARPTLAFDAKLCVAARAKAVSMANKGDLFHDKAEFEARIDAVYPNVWAAENVAIAATPPDAMSEWLASPSHREAILGDYTITGVGIAEARDGTVYWCQIFARV